MRMLRQDTLLYRCIPWMSVFFCLLVLGIGLFAQPSADDYDYAAVALKSGVWGTWWFEYLNWGGRFFSVILIAVFTGYTHWQQFYFLAPFFLLGSQYAAFFLLLYVVTKRLALKLSWGQLLLLTSVSFAIYFLAVLNPAQVFYWVAGGMTYSFANTATAVAIALLFWPQLRPGREALLLGALSVATLMVVGCNEVAGVLFDLFLVVTLAITQFAYRDVTIRRRALVALCFAVVSSLYVVLIPPGNDIRIASNAVFDPVANLLLALRVALPQIVIFPAKRFIYAPILLFAFFGGCLALVEFMKKRRLKTAALWNTLYPSAAAIGFTLAALFATNFFYAWGTSGEKAAYRTLSSPLLYFFLALAVCMWNAATIIVRRKLFQDKKILYVRVVSLWFVLVILLGYTLTILMRIPHYGEYFLRERTSPQNTVYQERQDLWPLVNTTATPVPPVTAGPGQ